MKNVSIDSNMIYSIENFKRPQTEVDALLKLAKEKFERLVAEKDRLEENGVKVNVLGNLNLLPEDLQELVHTAMNMTKTHSKYLYFKHLISLLKKK